MPPQEWEAGLHLRFRGRPSARRAPRDHIRHQHGRARQAHRGEHTVQEVSGSTRERPAGAVLVVSWDVSHNHQPGLCTTVGKHKVGGRRCQRAVGEACQRLAQRLGGIRRHADQLRPRHAAWPRLRWRCQPAGRRRLGQLLDGCHSRRRHPVDRRIRERFVRAPLNLQPQCGKHVHAVLYETSGIAQTTGSATGTLTSGRRSFIAAIAYLIRQQTRVIWERV